MRIKTNPYGKLSILISIVGFFVFPLFLGIIAFSFGTLSFVEEDGVSMVFGCALGAFILLMGLARLLTTGQIL